MAPANQILKSPPTEQLASSIKNKDVLKDGGSSKQRRSIKKSETNGVGGNGIPMVTTPMTPPPNLVGNKYKDSNSSEHSTLSKSTKSKNKKDSTEVEWKPYIEVPSKLYGRPFTISDSYLDLPDPPNQIPSLHKLIHRNRIVLLTMFLLFIILHKPKQFIEHINVFWKIFVNPIGLLPGLIMMHGLSFILPTVRYFDYYLRSKSINNKKNGANVIGLSKTAWVTSYLIIQASIISFSVLFELINPKNNPIGTSFFLILQLVVIIWKSHSYFMITNYNILHNKKNHDNNPPFTSFIWYIFDFYHYLLSPTLVYDQYWELKQVKNKPKRTILQRAKSIVTELYTSFVLLGLIHYLHMECIFPALFETPSIMSFVKMVIPAEINFQIQYYLLYHCVFSLLADISGFDDRLSFYEDYWSATTTKEILGKWSRPVHYWLYRHIHKDLHSLFGIGRVAGLFITMLFSGFFHEIVVISTSKNICIPWSTLNLLGCAVLITLEVTIKGLSESKIYRSIIRILLVVGHAAYYYAIYHLCFHQPQTLGLI